MKIAEIREELDMKQYELAKKVGITPAYLCDLEKGKKTNPSIKVLLGLSRALRVSVEELIGNKR